MTTPFRLSALRPDRFTLLLLTTVLLATVLPAQGQVSIVVSVVSRLAIGALFFFHGARLSSAAVIRALAHWRLHVTVLFATFILFPVIGLLAIRVPMSDVDASILSGILFLTLLPSTAQSSIAFTSIAGGNVAAAVCAASLSNLLGIVLTPALVGLLMSAHAEVSLSAVQAILVRLLLPFLAGQLARPWIGSWIERHKSLLSSTDRASVLLVVYAAFSAAVVTGMWHKLTGADLLRIAVILPPMFFCVLGVNVGISRALGFTREDEIAAVFCGSKKSLISGIPMAGVLFPAQSVGLVILPLMFFHQLQLIVCAVVARRYALSRPRSSVASCSKTENTQP